MAGDGDWASLQMHSLLGTGSFGFVFKVSNNDSLIALKLCFLEYNSDDKIEQDNEKQQMLREFELTKEKQHDNLVRILNCEERDLTADEISKIFDKISLENETVEERLAIFLIRARRLKSLPTLFLQMELCGPNLRKWITANNTSNKPRNSSHTLQSEQLKILQDLMKGLGFLHKNKLMHRDLRPENIMFSVATSADSSGFEFPLKIGDFGLCRKIHSEETMTGSLTMNVGMVEYRAPEVGVGHYTEKADLYSFGLIMWEVLQPMTATERKSSFQKLVYDRDTSVLANDYFVLNAKEIILGLTMAKPDDRFESIFKVKLEAKF